MDEVGPFRRLSLRGDLDLSTAPHLREALDELRHPWGSRGVIVDLTELNYVDSIGLGLFVTAHRRALAVGKDFIVLRPNPFIGRLLGMTGLADELWVLNDRRSLEEVLEIQSM
ncbi:MAG TPA: STAS domain-containing protein [Acidimicrobiales bacterium]